MISLSEVSQFFGPKVLYEKVSWQLLPGVHYGLVGANGSGKSTLLRMMSGEVRPEAGSVSRPTDMRLGVLPQDQDRFDKQTLLEVVLEGNPALAQAMREKDHLLATHGHDVGHDAGQRLGELEMIIADNDGYTATARASELLEGLGLPTERHELPMGQLSGGYRLRVLLAQTLFSQADVLLLDEPTNHLDIVSIRWLEGYLQSFPGTLVLVSHDRHFLNAVSHQIADLDYGELRLYPGDYDRFLQAKSLSVEQKEAVNEQAQKKIAETQAFINRFKAKASKARQASSRAKQVERMVQDLPNIQPSSRRFPRFSFQQTRASGKEVLLMENMSKGYGGPPVVHDLSFSLLRGEKMAVVGPNGIGKSTLLKVVVGALAPDVGKFNLGYEVQVGYFGQDATSMKHEKITLYEWLQKASPTSDVSTIRSALGRMLFSGDEADKPIRVLSGGEAARLHLARLMLSRNNFLVLDEPTNHLDMEGREALLEALQAYPGTLLFVSHDRHFVSHLANRVLALSPHGHVDHQGSYEDYLASQGADYLHKNAGQPSRLKSNKGQAPSAEGDGTQDAQARKAQRKASQRLEKQALRIEQDIARLEAEIAACDQRFATPGYYQNTSWTETQQAQQERDRLQQQLTQRMLEWERTQQEAQGA